MALVRRENLIDMDFERIPVDEEWAFDDQRENKMHRIHSYPAKFPAFITKKAIDYVEDKGGAVNTVGDIFCGCGTVAYESALQGKNFWGCDINPVAVLIAKTKCHSYKEETLLNYFSKIKREFSSMHVSDRDVESLNERIHYWFEKKQIQQLLKIKRSILQVTPTKGTPKYRYFFQTAFSNILKPTSKWLQKSIKPTIDPNKSVIDVWSAFSKQFNMMRVANEENKSNSNIGIHKKNILTMHISKPKIDLLVTSPPYVTSYEYADLHQMSSLWLDYTDDFKTLRKGTVGSLYHNSNFDENRKQLNESASEIMDKLIIADKRRAQSIAQYFVDIQECIKKSYALLSKTGHALFVVGNTEYKHIRINNAKHLIECMFNAGFKDINITKRKISNKPLTPYRTQSGKFTSDKTCRKIYAEEFIIKGSV